MPVSDPIEPEEASLDRTRLGQKLRDAREYLNLSQDEVARKVGIARAAISLIESGQRKVDALELKQLARIYQRPVNDFTGDDVSGIEAGSDVDFLARTLKGLSDKDREEVARFAEFLRAKNKMEGSHE